MKASSKGGQTLVEFAIVSVLFIFMLGLTFNTILAFCVHQYIAYATFMAARAYQASASTPNQQVANAQNTLAQLIPGLSASAIGSSMSVPVMFQKFSSFKALATITGVNIPSPQAMQYGLRAGSALQVSFQVPLTAGLPVGSAIGNSFAYVTLITESQLGREVTVQECQTYFQNRYMKILAPIKQAGAPGLASGGGQIYQYWQYMDDNGC